MFSKLKRGVNQGMGLFVQHKNETSDANGRLHHKMEPKTLQQQMSMSFELISCGQEQRHLKMKIKKEWTVLIWRIIAAENQVLTMSNAMINNSHSVSR